MASCLRVCLQSTLKILNSVIGLLGMAMIMYSLWMIRTCLQQVCEVSRGFSESSSSSSWFIFTFLGLGIFLCVLTCSGHIAAETINNHCLSCYAAVLFCLLLLEAAITADIFLNGHWEEAFPRDPTGRFNQFKEVVRSNSGLCQWIGLLIVAVQALSIFLSMVLRALGPEHRVYDDSDDDSLPATLPLLKSPPPGWLKVNVDGTLLSSGLAGIGVVFRDGAGDFIKAAGIQSLHWDSAFIEMQAMLAIGKLIDPWMYEYKGIILEGDNISVVNFLRKTMQQTFWSSLPQQAPDLGFLLAFHQVLFSHISRDFNRVADYCARLATEADFTWLSLDVTTLPSVFVSLFEDDKKHVASI